MSPYSFVISFSTAGAPFSSNTNVYVLIVHLAQNVLFPKSSVDIDVTTSPLKSASAYQPANVCPVLVMSEAVGNVAPTPYVYAVTFLPSAIVPPFVFNSTL